MSVPEKLEDQSDVNEDIVTGNHDLPPCLPGAYRSNEIARIAKTPDHQEKYR
jgi:hypothetical protein